jgi:hypothetical protein
MRAENQEQRELLMTEEKRRRQSRFENVLQLAQLKRFLSERASISALMLDRNSKVGNGKEGFA